MEHTSKISAAMLSICTIIRIIVKKLKKLNEYNVTNNSKFFPAFWEFTRQVDYTVDISRPAMRSSGFWSKNWLKVFLVPPGWDVSPQCMHYVLHLAGVERGTVRVQHLCQGQNAINSSRAQIPGSSIKSPSSYLRLPCLEQEEKMSRRLPLVLTLECKRYNDRMVCWSSTPVCKWLGYTPSSSFPLPLEEVLHFPQQSFAPLSSKHLNELWRPLLLQKLHRFLFQPLPPEDKLIC